MNSIIKALLLSSVASWQITLSVDVTSSIFLHQTIFGLGVRSDAKGYAQLPCTSLDLGMECSSQGPAESDQGGFTVHDLKCTKDKCCTAVITVNDDAPMDYNIDICAPCDDVDVSDTNDSGQGPSIKVANRDCYGKKDISLMSDGSIQQNGRKRSHKYRVTGDKNHGHKHQTHGHKYRAHGERNHGRLYKVRG